VSAGSEAAVAAEGLAVAAVEARTEEQLLEERGGEGS